MTNYTMTPINNGTRLRKDHNTFATQISSYNRGQSIEGDELWEAPANGNEVIMGDKWLHVISIDGVPLTIKGWMAYIHKGQPICENLTVDGEIPVPIPPPFPQEITLSDTEGNQAIYGFIRVVE